ncbi:uncharacterized protein [Parasteatoda tepidariorum]|nr:uncharacterized protein LOC107447724 isoform X2 [Parasteatoda tepidariorum]
MISIDSIESLDRWVEKADVSDYKCSALEDLSTFSSFNLDFLFGSSSDNSDSGDFYPPMDLDIDFNDMELEKNSYDFSKYCSSPVKSEVSKDLGNPYGFASVSPSKLGIPYILDDYFIDLNKSFSDQDSNSPIAGSPVANSPVTNSPIAEKQSAPLSPDSGFEQDCLNSSFDEYTNVFTLMEQDKDVDGMCEPIKLNTDTDIDKYLDYVIHANKNSDTDDEIYNKGTLATIRLSDIIDSDCMFRDGSNKVNIKPEGYLNGFQRTRNDSIASDHWLNETLQSIPNDEDFSALCAGLVLQPVKKEGKKLSIKEEVCDDNLFVLRNDSKTIQVEHSYHKKLSVVESEEEDEEPVKKRKRNEIDEDFSPYQKPKRRAGRPRTNFSKVDTPKTQRYKLQKTKSSKRTSQASKRLKSCSTVPFDRREQHNQAERERRDMLKKNLDIVEDATPDHVLQLTQLALQSEKTSKSDEFENNENNFTVDVLKKLDELVKKEPVCHRPKYKKASRNSKMVVLLGSTFYIGSLEKELKAKESRLAQLKKQYEECLKRLNPSKVSSKKVRRNY